MGEHTEYTDGTAYPVQCFRSFEVQQQQVSNYNQSFCGTQLRLFNQGKFQNVTGCRDGLGVVTGDAIESPAGVFFHRETPFPPGNGAVDDSNWYFQLSPSVLPLDASSQLDMQLTLLSSGNPDATQVECIAEYRVSEAVDGAPAILGQTLEPVGNPNGARAVGAASALALLPLLLLLL